MGGSKRPPPPANSNTIRTTPPPQKKIFFWSAHVFVHTRFHFCLLPLMSIDIGTKLKLLALTWFHIPKTIFFFIFISVVYIQECFLTMNAKSVSWPFLVQNSYCLFYTFLWLRRWDRTHLYTCETTNGLRYFAVFLIRWTHPLLTLALYIYVFARHVRYFQKSFFNCIKPCCIFQYQLSMLECEWTMKTVDLWNIMKRIWQKTVQDKILKHFSNENNRKHNFYSQILRTSLRCMTNSQN